MCRFPNKLLNLSVMNSYLIEIPHGAEKTECMKAIKLFLESGSHFLSHADWGCSDGEHKAWIIVEVENKGEAERIIPPLYRSQAKIIQLRKYTLQQMVESAEKYHTSSYEI